MASPQSSGGVLITLRTLLGKVLRRIERHLHTWQIGLLGVPAATKTERRDRARQRALLTIYEQIRLVDEPVPATRDEEGYLAMPTVGDLVRVRHEAIVWGDEDAFFSAMIRNEPFDDAIIASVRRLVAHRNVPMCLRRARSFAQALQSRPEHAAVGDIAMGLVGLADGVPGTAWQLFHRVDPALLMRLAPGEYFRTGFIYDAPSAQATLREVASGQLPIEASARDWLLIAKASFVAGDETDSAYALERAREAADGIDDTELHEDITWLSRWYGRAEKAREPVQAPAGTIPFAVLDYKQPDRQFSSSNLGDYVQTIASLGHVVRHQGFDFTGDPELVSVVEKLQPRVREDRKITGEKATLSLYRLDRDATNYFPVPEGTWAIAFGWYMHPMFKLKYDAPLNPNLRPVFVSFHINEIGLLSPEMIEYLKKYSPVGCRDWNTVHLLLAAGIPAFFSGCLTTTIDTVYAPAGVTGTEGTLFVDSPETGPGDFFTQVYPGVRDTAIGPNIDIALDRVEGYRSTYGKVVTSRLHCYLPARSIGANVSFEPKNPADVRFDGLAGIDDTEFDAIRSGILDKLNVVMSAIAAGRSEDEVYAQWREICAPDVAAAEARRADLPDIAPPTFDVAAACAEVRKRSVTIERSQPAPDGAEIHVEFSLDGNLKHQLAVVMESIVTQLSRPLRAYVLCRDHDQSDFDQMARLFPTVSFVWLPTDAVDYGKIIGMIKHITVATMDRLLLPELLPDLPKIVHHDLDALCMADLAGLYETDVSGTTLAGRASPQPGPRSGFQGLINCSKRLKGNQSLARELILRSHTRHTFNFEAFNAGIMVMNLDRMRADEFCRHFLPYAERFGMNDQEILNAYAGADRVELDDDWNRLPRLEIVDHPKIVHWAGFQKPWGDEYVQYQEKWIEIDEQVTARAASLVS